MEADGVGELQTEIQQMDQRVQAVSNDVRNLVMNVRKYEEAQPIGGLGRGPVPSLSRARSGPVPVTPPRTLEHGFGPMFGTNMATYGTDGGCGLQTRAPKYQAASEANQSVLEDEGGVSNGTTPHLNGTTIMSVTVLDEKKFRNGLERAVSTSRLKS